MAQVMKITLDNPTAEQKTALASLGNTTAFKETEIYLNNDWIGGRPAGGRG